MGKPLVEVPATHGTWETKYLGATSLPSKPVIAIVNTLSALISRLRNAFSSSHVLSVPFLGLDPQALTRET